jgi:hypothetical protein
MHKEKSEEIDTDELLGMEVKPRIKSSDNFWKRWRIL